MERDVRGVLLAMKEKIVRGWVQGNFRKDEAVCIYGAIYEATGLKPRFTVCNSVVLGRGRGRRGQIEAPIAAWAYVLSDSPLAKEVSTLLAETAGVSRDDLALWNDAPERTQGEVVDLIDKALRTLSETQEVGEVADHQ